MGESIELVKVWNSPQVRLPRLPKQALLVGVWGGLGKLGGFGVFMGWRGLGLASLEG